MTNTFAITVYAALALSSLIILVLTLRKPQRNKLDSSLIFITIMLLCWELCEIAFYALVDPVLIQIAFDLKLPFVNLVALSWFLFVIRFYGIDSSFTKPVIVAMFVIPTFTFVLALTTTQHDLLREQFVLLEASPLREYINVRGPWFWLHTLYGYLLVVAGVVISLIQHRKVPKGYRAPSSLLIAGLMVTAVANMAVVMSALTIDLSLVGAAITAVILYVVTKNYQGLSFLIEAHKEAFHHIEEAVFILNTERGIVNMNRSAELWLTEIGTPSQRKDFSEIMDRVDQIAVKQNGQSDEEAGEDYRFESGVIYNIKEKSVFDNEGKTIASFVFVADETNNRELIEYLDKHSGIDALTGLSNRRRHEEDASFLDQEEFYPLGVLYGDLNNLKEVNDTQGHQQGDVLLRLAAEALKTASPPSARISRIGGDEFVVLLPNHDDAQMRNLMQDIRDVLDRESARYPFEASIALGYSIKYIKAEPMTEILNTADENMYADKKHMKELDRTSLWHDEHSVSE